MKIRLIIIFIYLVSFHLSGQNLNYEGYYLLESIYPNDADAFWFPNDTEIQGVTNDGKNWFITTTGHTDAQGPDYWGRLWRIPKSVPLGAGSTTNPNVASIAMADIPALSADVYWHWGDPDHYEYNGVDYILVPTYSVNGGGIIACFRAEPLRYVSFATIPFHPGWCAVDNEGYLYSSFGEAKAIRKFEVNWELLTTPNSSSALTPMENIDLRFKGNRYETLKHMQGGEFSPSGELLYLVSGSAGCLGFGPGEPQPSDGIHVFQTSDWKEIETSTKRRDGEEYFLYDFDNDCEGFFGSESPEGLTIWDLDDGGVNEHHGSLHVLVFHWNLALTGSNDHKVSMFHYSNKLHLDSEAEIFLNGPTTGNKPHPFQNLNDATSFYPVWDGADLIFKAGDYRGAGNRGLTIDKKVKMTSEGGSAIIGRQ
jgi:hypothetical protein